MKISGQWLTDRIRDLVLSKNYRGAMGMLTEDIGLSADQAFSVMRGDVEMKNCTAEGEDHLLTLIPTTDREKTTAFLEDLRYQTCGILRQENKFYQAVSIIMGSGPAKGYRPLYMDEGDIFFNLKVPHGKSPTNVVFGRLDDAPPWMMGFTDPQEALDDLIAADRPLDEVGHVANPRLYKEDFFAKDEERARHNDERDAQFGEEVRKRAETDGGFFTLDVKNVNNDIIRQLRVPTTPFNVWALSGTNARAMGLMPEWQLVCPGDLKMQSDNPMHSDWWFGAGLNADDYAGGFEEDSLAGNISRAADNVARDLRKRLLKWDAKVLSGKGLYFGLVRNVRPGETLKENEIGVISHAGPEYATTLASAAKVGAALICLTGGPLAHLATLAREDGVLMMMWEDARHLQNGDMVTLDADNCAIFFD
jgi:hypothetical protein